MYASKSESNFSAFATWVWSSLSGAATIVEPFTDTQQLAGRTLTNLYSQRPTWLDLAHRRLDEAVCAAYGWPPDLADEEILARLLALNLERKAAE